MRAGARSVLAEVYQSSVFGIHHRRTYLPTLGGAATAFVEAVVGALVHLHWWAWLTSISAVRTLVSLRTSSGLPLARALAARTIDAFAAHMCASAPKPAVPTVHAVVQATEHVKKIARRRSGTYGHATLDVVV